MKKSDRMDEHLDIRVSKEQLTEILRRVPEGVSVADWVRATLLGQPVQKSRVVRRTTYRDCTPYEDRLRQDALLSVAATLSRMAATRGVGMLEAEIRALLGLVRVQILRKPSC